MLSGLAAEPARTRARTNARSAHDDDKNHKNNNNKKDKKSSTYENNNDKDGNNSSKGDGRNSSVFVSCPCILVPGLCFSAHVFQVF